MPSLLTEPQKLDSAPRAATTTGSFGMSAFDGTGRAYVARLARRPGDLRAAQALRSDVLKLEPQDGPAASLAPGLDADPYDDVCDHLIAERLDRREIVGTYRLQTGLRAAVHRGYYSAQKFDLSPFDAHRGEILELGPASIAKAHRNLAVLQLLWRGITFYAQAMGARYLLGCSWVPATDPRLGARLYSDLMRAHLAPPTWQTQPLPSHACPLDELSPKPQNLPKLLAADLELGARVCGPPALDRESKTIEFLTFLDLQTLPERAASCLFTPNPRRGPVFNPAA